MLHYRESGVRTAPAIVLLHGLFGDKDNLGQLARRLEAEYRVVAIDLPNHGQSPWQDDVSWSSQRQQLAATLMQLSLPPCHLLGHSLGGKLAMQYALLSPQQVQSLTVVDIAPVTYRQQRHQAVFSALAAVATARPSNRGEAEQLMSPYLEDPAVRQFLLKSFVPHTGWRFNLAGLQHGYDTLMAWPEESGSFPGPTLFIKGGQSDYLLAEHQACIMRLFPAARAKIIADAGHWLHAEKPQLFQKLVVDFLSTVG